MARGDVSGIRLGGHDEFTLNCQTVLLRSPRHLQEIPDGLTNLSRFVLGAAPGGSRALVTAGAALCSS